MDEILAAAARQDAHAALGRLTPAELAAGKTAGEALAALVAADPEASVRQVAILGADGGPAAHTGDDCIADAGHQLGDAYSVQANIMRTPRVWPAMAAAFESATGTLARRLLTALAAAEDAGGDWRGMQAAGLLVVAPDGRPWERVVDLRVEDHAEPLKELRRLLDLGDGYNAIFEGEARGEAARAFRMDALDVRFADVLDAAHADDVARARELLSPLLAEEPRWADYVRVLGARGLLPHADELV